MRIFNVAIVIVMIAIGAALLFLSFRAYRQTGNALLSADEADKVFTFFMQKK